MSKAMSRFLAGMVFGLVGGLSLQAQSNNTANPFNQYMTPVGGVDLFSGNAVRQENLLTFSGGRGLSIGVTLSYSSNIYLQVRSHNRKTNVGPVGLGWRFGFGQIVCNHNGTGYLEDDEFTYISPEGVSQRILFKPAAGPNQPAKWFLERQPYWKVEQKLFTNGNPRVKGWILTDISGIRYLYGDNALDGDPNPDNVRSATQYLYSNFGEAEGPGAEYSYYSVGIPLGGSPELYPVAWSMAEIRDLAGGFIKFKYEQALQNIVTDTWSTQKKYTKYANIDTVFNSEGDTLAFDFQRKNDLEFYDDNTMQLENPFAQSFNPNFPNGGGDENGDAFGERFNPTLLSRIKVINRNGDLTREYVLTYEKLDPLPGSFRKSLLTRIRERAPKADGNGSRKIGETFFEYIMDKNEDLNYGALKKVTGDRCGSVEYEYVKQDHKVTSSFTLGPTDEDNVSFGKGAKFRSGTLKDGTRYFLVAGAEGSAGKLWLYQMDGNKLIPIIKNNIFNGENLNFVKIDEVYPFSDYAVILGRIQGNTLTTISVLNYVGNEWVKSQELWDDNLGLSSLPSEHIHGLENSLFAAGHTFDPSPNTLILNYQWNGKDWAFKAMVQHSGMAYSKECCPSHPSLIQYQVGNNFIAANWNDGDNVSNLLGFSWDVTTIISNFDGRTWKTTSLIKNQDKDTRLNVVGDYIVHYRNKTVGKKKTGGNGRDTRGGSTSTQIANLGILRWSGEKWVDAFNTDMPYWPERSFLGSGEDYFLNRVENKETIYAFNWDGSHWNYDILNHYGRGGNSGGNPGRGFAAVLHGHKKWNGVPRTRDHSQFKIFTHDNSYNWKLALDKGTLGNKHEKATVVGDDFVVVGRGGDNTALSEATGYFHYDGIDFHKQSNDGGISNAFPCGHDCYKEVHRLKDRETYRFNFQGKFNVPFHAFKVSRKIIEDGVSATGKAIYEYRYDLDEATFNRQAGTAMHRKVSVLYPEGNGRTVTKFHNNPESNINEADRHLYGMIEEVSDFKQGDYQNPIKISRTGYEVFRGPADGSWPKDIKVVRPNSQYINSLGLEMTTTMEYNDENGLQKAAVMTNSDETKKRTETRFAFDLGPVSGKPEYELFRTRNLLAATAGNRTIEIKKDGTSKVVAAGTQTYRLESGFLSGLTVPIADESFVYNDKDGTGFKEFRYDNPIKSEREENWESLGKISRLDAQGHIIQTENVFGVKSASLVGKGGALPMAQVLNAGYDEVGIFTGDYPVLSVVGDYFDTKNAWFKGDAEIKILSPTARHFQEAAIFVQGDDDGPYKNLNLSQNARPYTFSAWVYSADVNVTVDLKVKGEPHIIPIGAQNTWQLISISLTAAEASGNPVQIQVAPGNGKEFYVSDIRFFPQDARVVTNYYSPLLDLPIAQVGEDNTFSVQEFDELGRVVKSYGQKPTGEKILLSTMDYLDKGCPSQPFSDKLKAVRFRCEEPISFALDPLNTTNIYNIKLPATCDLVMAKATPQDPKAELVVKVDGTEAENFSNLFGNWIPFVAKQSGTTSLILEVNGNAYTFHFTRSTTCWNYYDPAKPNYSGTQGDNPSLALQGDGVPVMALGDLLNRKKGFAQLPIAGEEPFSTYRATDISLQLKGAAPYEPVVSFLEHVPKASGEGFDKKLKVRRYIYQPQSGETQGWTSYGSEVATGEVALPSLALMNGNPLVAYVDDLAKETANEGPVVLGANFFVDDLKLEIAFSKPINDASWNVSKLIRISTDKGVTQTVTLAAPLSVETGDVANDEILVLNVSESARTAIQALDGYPVGMEIEVASGLAKSLSGAKDNQAATFLHKVTMWVTQNIDHNEKKPTLLAGEILRDEMLLELRFNKSIRDNSFNNGLTLRLSTDNGGGNTISIPLDGRFHTRSVGDDNTIGIFLEEAELTALELLANVGSALELELPQGLLFDEIGNPNLAETFSKNFHISYNGVGTTPVKKTRLFIKRYQKNQDGSEQWIGLGDGNGDGTPDGLVSSLDASSVSLAVSASGVPFVAYVGDVEYKCTTDPSNKCFDGEKSKFILMKQIIVKKWNPASGPNGAWVSVSTGIPGGDFLDVNAPANVKLRLVGETPYILYDYLYRPAQDGDPDHPPREETGDYAIVMRKFDPTVTVPIGDDPASHWVAISDFGHAAVEDEAPLFYKSSPKGNFDFVIKNNVPYAAFADDKFTRTNGMYAATVIKFANGKWNSLGVPNFIRVSASQSGSPLALAVQDDGAPILAAINERIDAEFPEGYTGPGDRTISLYKFNASSSCSDPSFNGLVVKDKANGTELSLNWPFKQYFLNYTVNVENSVGEVEITPSANKCSDLKRVSHENDELGPRNFWPPTDLDDLCGQNPIGPMDELLTVGTNQLRVRGWDLSAETQVEYGIKVVRKESSTPTALAFAVTTPSGEILEYSPTVEYQGAVKAHTIEEVGNTISEIRIKSVFGSNTRVTLNGTTVATNINYPIPLKVKGNTIQLDISVDGIGDAHTLKIYRHPIVPDIDDPPPIVSVLKITDPQTGQDYHPALITGGQYVVKAPGTATSVIISNADGNTCIIKAGATLVGPGGAEILLTGEQTKVTITENCGGVKTEFQVVIIRDPTLVAKLRYIVGRQELGDPPGFYSFQSLKEAQLRLQDFSLSQKHYLVPKVFDIFVVADRGTDIISSEPTELIPFANSTGLNPSEGIWNGVLKDSPLYQQLVDEFNNLPPVP